MSFVMESGMLSRRGELGEGYSDDEYYMTWEEFCEEYQKYCKATGSKRLNLTSEDSYLSTFIELKLNREHTTLPDYNKGSTACTTYWVLGCRLTSSFITKEAAEVLPEQGTANRL